MIIKQIYEYILNKDSKIIKKFIGFPRKPIEEDIILFLEDKNFKRIEGIEDKIFGFDANIEKSKGLSYAFINRNNKIYNVIYFYEGGKITEYNPLFKIIVYKKEKDIDETYISGEIYFSKEIQNKNRYNHDEYDKFIKEINKYFRW